MTIAFSSVMAVFIIERIDEVTGRASLAPLLGAGVVSVGYWWYLPFPSNLKTQSLIVFGKSISIMCAVCLFNRLATGDGGV